MKKNDDLPRAETPKKRDRSKKKPAEGAPAQPEATTTPKRSRGKKGDQPEAPPEVMKEKLKTETMPDGRKVQQKVITLKESLRCPLTDSEMIAKAQELARAVNDVASEQDRQAEIKTELKAKLARFESVRDELTTIVGNGHEWRNILVEEIFSYATRTVRKVRTDTGEQLSERGMSDAEMQMALPLKDDKGKGKDAKPEAGKDGAPLTAKVAEFPKVVQPPAQKKKGDTEKADTAAPGATAEAKDTPEPKE